MPFNSVTNYGRVWTKGAGKRGLECGVSYEQWADLGRARGGVVVKDVKFFQFGGRTDTGKITRMLKRTLSGIHKWELKFFFFRFDLFLHHASTASRGRICEPSPYILQCFRFQLPSR